MQLQRPYIMDVGGGNDPFQLANIILDKYLADTIHRRFVQFGDDTRCPLVVGDRVLVNADVSALPFPDKSIDFIWCSHVLEHVEKPLIAIGELCRVGKAGVIILPSIGQEALFQQRWHKYLHSHRWVCWRDWQRFYFMRCDTADKPETHRVLDRMQMLPPRAVDAYTEIRLHWGADADRFKDGVNACIVEFNEEQLATTLDS